MDTDGDSPKSPGSSACSLEATKKHGPPYQDILSVASLTDQIKYDVLKKQWVDAHEFEFPAR